MGLFSFRKEERLSSKKNIKELFQKGSSFYVFPYKVIFLQTNQVPTPSHQVLLSVSSRNFKRAVDRNLIKRRMRESYRLQKSMLAKKSPLLIAFIYTATEIQAFKEMHNKMLIALSRIEKKTKNIHSSNAPQD